MSMMNPTANSKKNVLKSKRVTTKIESFRACPQRIQVVRCAHPRLGTNIRLYLNADPMPDMAAS